jgi:penicillin-binding protein 1A
MPYPLAGKTGTTNDFTDAWFVGFSPTLTCGIWMGYDEKKTLGEKESGGHAALPIWIQFMSVALAGKDPGEFQPMPLPRNFGAGQKVDTPDVAPGDGETH